ncbi:MAG TPA: hypothetical protein VGL76_07660 [Gaiellaceae bacterium]
MSTHLHLPVFAGKRRSGGRRLLLITGTPGTGKRPLASYLQLERGFTHVDLDNRETRTQLLRSGESEFRTELAALAATTSKVVVTWSFSSETQLAYVETMQRLGFEWIWMDGDRGAALDTYLAPIGTMRMPRFVDPFESDGRFRPLATVTDELRRRRPLPLPKPVRAARVSLRAPAWAGVGAFVAAALGVGVAYVAGALGPANQPRLASVQASSREAMLPENGVLVAGKSLGGVELGDTTSNVIAKWGRHFSILPGSPTTWLYVNDDGSGAAVSFRGDIVTGVFTLGMPDGWHTSNGVRVGTIFDKFNDMSGSTTACSGYGAVSTRSGQAVTSILTIGNSVYGFALTRPSEPICH